MFARLLIAVLLLASLAINALLLRGRQEERRTENWGPSVDRVAVIRTEGGLLQVSTIQSPETFSAVKPHHVLGLDVGATTSHIRVPAAIHYHIELAREWKVRVRPDGSVLVIAPAVKPTLPVAIDTARLERFAQGRWSLFTAGSELDALQRTITDSLAAKAGSASYLAFQREAARQTVMEFVRQWLLTQERWRELHGKPVRVFFADEPISALPDLLPNPAPE
jgi:hypothetical protein